MRTCDHGGAAGGCHCCGVGHAPAAAASEVGASVVRDVQTERCNPKTKTKLKDKATTHCSMWDI